MRQIIEDADLTQKTIERVAHTDNAYVLFFTDDTFCVFKGCGYDEWDVELSDRKMDLSIRRGNISSLRELGLISTDKAREFIAEYQQEDRLDKIEKEKSKLAKLKAKYPNH